MQLLYQCKKLIPQAFVGVVLSASSQGVTAARSFVQGMALPSAPELPGLQRFIGKRYWITPKTNARYRIRFQTIAAGTVADDTFFVTEPASVSIAGFDARTPRHAIVRFFDGRMAVMDEPVLYNSRSDQLFVIERSPNGIPEDGSTEYLHTAPPETYARAEHRMQANRAAAKVRAGVTLGMTADLNRPGFCRGTIV
jgi:hypothetical protein